MMKKIIVFCIFIFCFCESYAQIPADTNELRTKIDEWVGANKNLSGIRLNNLLHGFANFLNKGENVYPKYPLQLFDSAGKKRIRIAYSWIDSALSGGGGGGTWGSITGTLSSQTDLNTALNNRWNLSGNAGTSSSNYIGTSDAQPLYFGYNGIKSGIIDGSTGNTSIGYKAMFAGTHFFNTAFGSEALSATAVSSASNAAFGYQSLKVNTSGGTNTAVGYRSLWSNTTGSDNVAIGSDALLVNGANYNTAVGSSSLRLNNGGQVNTALGFGSLSQNVSGSNNTAVGASALTVSTTSNNTAVGYQSLYNNNSGASNIALGAYAGKYNGTQSNRFFINNTDQTNYTGDTSNSIVYGVMNASPSSQYFKINGNLVLPIGAAAGYLLTSDSYGKATWQAAAGSGITSVSAGYGTSFTTITSAGSVAVDSNVIKSTWKARQDSSALRAAIQLNNDSITAHNIRIGKNSDSLTAHNLRIGKNSDSLTAHNTRIGAVTALTTISKQGDTVNATLSNAAGNIWYRVNPNVSKTALTYTFPPSPFDTQLITFNFGGLITTDATEIIGILTFLPNTGQGIASQDIYYSVRRSDCLKWRFDSLNSKWYLQ
jgi:hypothetical protein